MVYNGYYKVMSNIPKMDSYQPLMKSDVFRCFPAAPREDPGMVIHVVGRLAEK